jgi:biotin carboxyl carrier protein
MVDGEMRTDTLAHLALPGAPTTDDEAWRAAACVLQSAGDGVWGGGWRLNAAAQLRLQHDDEVRSVDIDATVARTAVRDADSGDAFVDVDGQSVEFGLAPPPSVDETVRHASLATAGHATLTAPMPGRIIAVRAAEGALVHASQPVVIIEAMKMEHAVVSPVAGRVIRLQAQPGAQVQRGDVLAEVEA